MRHQTFKLLKWVFVKANCFMFVKFNEMKSGRENRNPLSNLQKCFSEYLHRNEKNIPWKYLQSFLE